MRLLAIEEGDENQDGEDYCRYDHVDKEIVGDCVELAHVHDGRDDAEAQIAALLQDGNDHDLLVAYVEEFPTLVKEEVD